MACIALKRGDVRGRFGLSTRVALREHALELAEELLDVLGVERRRHDQAEMNLVVLLFRSGSNRDGNLAVGRDVR